MVTVKENGSDYVVTFPRELGGGLSLQSYQQIRKFSYPQMNKYMTAVYAAAVYEKRDPDDDEILMDFRDEVMPIITRVLGLTEEAAEEIAAAIETEVGSL